MLSLFAIQKHSIFEYQIEDRARSVLFPTRKVLEPEAKREASFRHRHLQVLQEFSELSRLRNEVEHPKGLALTTQRTLATAKAA